MNVFVDSNCIAILNVLNESKEGVFGAVRFQKLLFLVWKELNTPICYTFYKREMGPHSRELKTDLEYLAEIGCINIETSPTAESNDLFIYRISSEGKRVLSRVNPYEAYIDRFKLLLSSYGYKKLDDILDYVHTNYKDDVYAPKFEEVFDIVRKDSQLAEMFWENVAKEYEGVTPFWYLSVLLKDVARKIPEYSGVYEIIFEMYLLLMEHSKTFSRYLAKRQPIPAIEKSLRELIYDKCYTILKAVHPEMVIEEV